MGDDSKFRRPSVAGRRGERISSMRNARFWMKPLLKTLRNPDNLCNGRRVVNCPKGDDMLKKLISGAAGALLLAACSANAGGEAAKQDIVDTAVSAGTFNTLVAAVQAADLVDTLKSPGPFTVFAPTDDAFAALPEGTVETLLKPENKDKLVAVLTYHVVAGEVTSADISGKMLEAPTVQGANIAIDATSGVKVNDATVVAADIDASNGVIHVIDKVILPPA
jgi:uncharacterized surface protein with fasciclin (FAS1) repeats